VRAITGLCNSLGMATTAEGVETEEQLRGIELEGCSEAQGYLFSPPKPASEASALIAQFGPDKQAP
jgi:EAL domain-containing protein (putative c-di-GMP-specific phosphodiesterase class I)